MHEVDIDNDWFLSRVDWTICQREEEKKKNDARFDNRERRIKENIDMSMQ